MQWDTEEPAKRARERDTKLRRYLQEELGRFSDFYERRLKEAHIEFARVRGLADLGRVRPTTWDDVAGDPEAFLIQPSRRDLARSGDRRLVLTLLAARVFGRVAQANRDLVEPRYKPVLWLLEDGVPVGYTDADLEMLAEAGSRVLTLAGLDRNDVVVGLTEAGPALAHWQLVLGARHAGVASVHLGPDAAPDAVVAARPTVLAGAPEALRSTLVRVAEAGQTLDALHTVLVTGVDPDAGTRDALAMAAAHVAPEAPVVVATWAPRGVRAQWAECRGGSGFHTFPDLEIIEVARSGGVHPSGPGELIWSGLGWRGTGFFRLLTGADGELVDGRCAACQRRGPMVITGSRDALGPLEVLEERSDLAGFQIEIGRRNGNDEVVVFLALRKGAELEEVLTDLDADLDAVQYVVLTPRQMDARMRSLGSRVVDTR